MAHLLTPPAGVTLRVTQALESLVTLALIGIIAHGLHA